ncbi:MAG: efflux transporter outer membrane subunit [Desulfovibrio sp.]|jgi:NodT family efflux transporter outer membrane factor (OMF) lipoprotein|nr:efflux transporter outer membrane subunit [Desulfovibrio sp.]
MPSAFTFPRLITALALIFLILSGGCVNLSPDYVIPSLPEEMPVHYKEGGTGEDGTLWRPARPAVSGGNWWGLFADPVLDELMQSLTRGNQDIAAAAANLRAAAAQVTTARAMMFPVLGGPFSTDRSGSEILRASSKYSAGFQSSWELSFWNYIPGVERALAETQAAAADLAALRLLLQAELAQNYFLLRSLDSRQALYESTIGAYKRASDLALSQFRGGLATRADYDQAEAQLAGAQAQLASLKRQRAELEHGIALLCGKAAPGFSLARAPLPRSVPQIQPGLPAALLERRPDVAAAERRVAAANQQIGVARAAWFPSLTLGGNLLWQAAGWQSAALYTWSLGPGGALNIFEGGRTAAQSDAAWAQYDREVANYRQCVLTSLREVEDNLSALRYLEQEGAARTRAAAAARSALRIALSQYKGGLTTYLQVVSSQTTALSNESSVIEVQGLRLVAVVNLIKALGGGFARAEIDKPVIEARE